ncbi:MAG: class I SAM-dependent methyltransferase [Elusimicrobia bacterium]|nr:class I SAM-dependent methyltransferase [Elusimicrobiota bacterium]
MSLQTSYTLLAPFYDWAVARVLRRPRQLSLRQIPNEPGLQVLINGVGTGLDLPFLPEKPSYFGLDLTAAMLKQCLSRRNNLRISLIQGDSQRLPFPDASFDVCVCHLILAIIPDAGAGLREVHRVLKKGGSVFIFDKFLKRGERAWFKRLLSPVTGAIVTKLNVDFEQALAQGHGLNLESDNPSIANGWFRLIRLTKG